MSDTKPLLSRRLDRRAFLGGAGLAAGAVVATALVPLSIVHSVPAQATVALTPNADDPSWNGHVDDAWGHWPPYSHPIPYNVARVDDAFAANVDSVDYFLIPV
jgi:hypothetical protein